MSKYLLEKLPQETKDALLINLKNTINDGKLSMRERSKQLEKELKAVEFNEITGRPIMKTVTNNVLRLAILVWQAKRKASRQSRLIQ